MKKLSAIVALKIAADLLVFVQRYAIINFRNNSLSFSFFLKNNNVSTLNGRANKKRKLNSLPSSKTDTNNSKSNNHRKNDKDDQSE